MQPCPVCENKAQLASMEMTPELVEELSAAEEVGDPAGELLFRQRLDICSTCSNLTGGMTCSVCGCFVQFRARHSTAHCAEGKW